MRNKLFILSLLFSLLSCGQGGYSGGDISNDDVEEEEEYEYEQGNTDTWQKEYTDEENEEEDEDEYSGGDVKVKVEYTDGDNTYNNRNVFRDDAIFKDINKGKVKVKGNTINNDSINIDSIR